MALCIFICSIWPSCCPWLRNGIGQLVLHGIILCKYYHTMVSLRPGTGSSPSVSSLLLSHPPNSHSNGVLNVGKAGMGSPFRLLLCTEKQLLKSDQLPGTGLVGSEDNALNKAQHQQDAPSSKRNADRSEPLVTV